MTFPLEFQQVNQFAQTFFLIYNLLYSQVYLVDNGVIINKIFQMNEIVDYTPAYFKILRNESIRCGEHQNGVGLLKCPRTIYISSSSIKAGVRKSQRDRQGGIGLKIKPVVYYWMNGAEWVNLNSYEVMKMKVNAKPVTHPKGILQGGEEINTMIDTEYFC